MKEDDLDIESNVNSLVSAGYDDEIDGDMDGDNSSEVYFYLDILCQEIPKIWINL